MSALRNINILSSRFLAPRVVLCFLLGALCLLAFPKRNAQTASSPAPVPRGTVSPETLQANSIAARVANLNERASLSKLPEPNDNPGALLAMASGDFDEDGINDLVVGSGKSGRFALSTYHGNPDSVYPDAPDARQRRSQNRSNRAALSPGESFPLGASPDLLVAGDFDGDGHLDLATATRGSSELNLVAGNGRGQFASVQRIELAGRVTALGAGETSESGGLAVGIVGNAGPSVVLFRSPGQSASAPETIPALGEVEAIAFRRSNLRKPAEILIGAGRELMVRSLGLAEGETEYFSRQYSLSSNIRSIVPGNFVGDRNSDVAVLTANGRVSVLSETPTGDLDRDIDGFLLGPGSNQLYRARVSGSERDDLVAIDPASRRLHLLVDASTSANSDPRNRVYTSLEIEGELLDLLPMRLSEGALDDLVILRAGQSAPASLHITAAMTFLVTNTSDSGAGSLRQAINDANGNAGIDTINFDIPGAAPHTIGLLSPLPAITEGVTVNGASQPDFAGTPVVELNGISAGVSDGLTINTASSVVRSLVINRFSGSGIVLNGNGNIVEGNFIGTSTTGTFALGNNQDGVSVVNGSGNTIGGTTSAARNILSANRNGIQITGGSGTQIRGNFIGTDVSGTAGLGNSANGILIGGSSGNLVGSVGSASANSVAFNGSAGVAVTSGTGNSVQSNSIFSNGGLGIDLGPAGVTPNDAGDVDIGANNLQNFPVLDSADAAGTSTAIEGTLNSTGSTTFRLEFFSNQAPNPSGFGEGQTFIGAINVTTDAAGDASFNPTFPVTVAPGLIVTATATDPGGNTSEFSRAIQVGGLSGGTPADLSVVISMAPTPVVSGSQVTKTIIVTNAGPATATSVTVSDVLSSNLSFVSCNSTAGGVCGGSGNNRNVTFASLPPGTALITIIAGVSCSVANGTVIGNTVTVFSSSTPDPDPANNVSTATTTVSNPPPTIACPPNITALNDPGECNATVSFALPLVNDNCPGSNVVCSPPSGSDFAIGVTTVTCVATDAGGATATCSFTVTVNDSQPIAISCPPNVTVTASAGNCTPVVIYPTPAVVDNCPGANVACVPPSGSSFPIGVTNVVCTAVDAQGGQAICSFIVNVIGTPQAVVRLEGNGPALEFGPVPARRKAKKLKKQPTRVFTIENVGCIELVLTLDSISRVGNDVNRGRIGDPDDRNLFRLSLVDALGVDTPVDILSDIRIATGQKRTFKVRFVPIIPEVANRTRGLRADQVLPDFITSQVTFTQNGGGPIRINLVGHLTTEVVLINPDNPRVLPLIAFGRDGNDFVFEYSIFDSDTNVNRAVYQFFDKKTRPVEKAITVDLGGLVEQSDFVTGQSFTIVQRISGASDHKDIAGVLVTVFDPESSDAAASVPGAGVASLQSFGIVNFGAAKLSVKPLSLPPIGDREQGTAAAMPGNRAIDRSRRER